MGKENQEIQVAATLLNSEDDENQIQISLNELTNGYLSGHISISLDSTDYLKGMYITLYTEGADTSEVIANIKKNGSVKISDDDWDAYEINLNRITELEGLSEAVSVIKKFLK